MTHETRPKYLSIAENIETRIRAGEWVSNRFPSVRDVAVQHQVSIVTASRALQVLRDKGLIRTVERSGNYVEPAAHGEVNRFALCQRISPGPWRNATSSILSNGFAVASEHIACHLDSDLFSFGAEADTREIERLVKQARTQKISGLFLLPSRLSDLAVRQDEALVTACNKELIPVVLLERNLRGARTNLHDMVAGDEFAGARELVQHLIEQRCGKIAFVSRTPGEAHDLRLAGYLVAMHHAGMPSHVLEPKVDLPLRQACHQLVDQLLQLRVDGVICHRDDTAVGIILELMSRGLTVPGDVAVAGFDDLPVGETFSLGVTTYKLPADRIAREALHLMRRRIDDARAPILQVTIPGRLIVRESTERRTYFIPSDK